jgi:hypothetical protein
MANLFHMRKYLRCNVRLETAVPDWDSFYVYLIFSKRLTEQCLTLGHYKFISNLFQFPVYCLVTDALRGTVRIMERAVNKPADTHG